MMSSFRTILTFMLLIFLARIVGRKLISKMTFFNFVIGITLGSVASKLVVGAKWTTASSAMALVMFAVLTILTGWLSLKSQWFRKKVESEPVVVIANGRIIEENMRKTRFSLSDLLMELREKNAFNIADVEFALMENNGKISVLKKSQKEPATPGNLQMNSDYQGLTKDLIMDGQVLEENLRDINLDRQWLAKAVKVQGFAGFEEILYAGLDTQGNLYLSPKTHGSREEHGEYGLE